jgi:uncharacterized protein (DUF2461 family)
MISKEALQFIDDLKANNNKDWFHENKKRYESFKKDYYELIFNLLEVMKPLDKSLEILAVILDSQKTNLLIRQIWEFG